MIRINWQLKSLERLCIFNQAKEGKQPMGRRIDRYQALAEAHDFPIPIGKSFGMFISAVSEGARSHGNGCPPRVPK